jgi:predicted site-specific integrase-resolvase
LRVRHNCGLLRVARHAQANDGVITQKDAEHWVKDGRGECDAARWFRTRTNANERHRNAPRLVVLCAREDEKEELVREVEDVTALAKGE